MNVHRCRFVDYQPSAVNAIAFSHRSDRNKPAPSQLRLAVGRANGDIEIWRFKGHWIYDLTLKGGYGRSVEGLAWVSNGDAPPRLFSIGYSTYVTEWDLAARRPVRNVDCNSGAVWSLAVSPDMQTLALGCDNGSCVLMDISGGFSSIEYSRTLTRQRSRILSLAWKSNGFIIGGCADAAIRMWDVHTPSGQIAARMKVDKVRGEDTLVWSVLVLPDGTIVSGDSTGSIKFWDKSLHAFRQSYRAHAADIMCMTASTDGQMLFSCGVDRKMAQHRHGKNGKWSQMQARRFHAHDVLAMAGYEASNHDTLVTGSTDTCLCFMSFRGFMKTPHRMMHPTPPRPVMATSRNARLMMMWDDRKVKIWKIASHHNNLQSDLSSDQKQQLVLVMSLQNVENLTSAALSSDGKFLAVSTLLSTKLFQLSEKPDSVGLHVRKIRSEYLDSQGAISVQFSPDGSRLVLGQVDGEVSVVHIDPENPKQLEVFEVSRPEPMIPTQPNDYSSSILDMAISGNQEYLALTTFSRQISVYSLASLSHICDLPRLPALARGMAFKPGSPDLLVCATAANGIVEYDIRQQGLSEWSKRNLPFMPREIESVIDRVVGISVDESRPDRVWVWGASFVGFIDTSCDMPVKSRTKRRRGTNQDTLHGNDQQRSSDNETHFSEATVRRLAKEALKDQRRRQSAESNPKPLREKQPDEMNVDEALQSDTDSDVGDHSQTLVNGVLTETDTKNSQEEIKRRPHWVSLKYRPLLLCDVIGPNELVIVERPLTDILTSKQVPARYHKHEFGS